MAEIMSPLVKLLTAQYQPVQTAIMTHLDVSEVVALSRTCKILHPLWHEFTKTKIHFNIDYMLRPFFRDPNAFRNVQAKCGALMTELTAHRFFTRGAPPRRDFVLWVPEAELPVLHEYLLTEGYDKEDDMLPLDQYGVAYKKPTNPKAHRRLKVFTEDCPAEVLCAVLANSITTAGFSFISWKKAYSIFPAMTFINKQAFLTTDFGEDIAPIVADLTRQEGIVTKSTTWFQGATDRTITRPRRIYDKYTWIIDLPTEGIKAPDVDHMTSAIESGTFRLKVRNPDPAIPNRVSRYLEGCETLRHPVLRQPIMILIDNYQRKEGPFWDLKARLNEATMMEMIKIPADKRPPEYDEFVAGRLRAEKLMGKFTLPETWTFYDEDVVAYMADWVEKNA